MIWFACSLKYFCFQLLPLSFDESWSTLPIYICTQLSDYKDSSINRIMSRGEELSAHYRSFEVSKFNTPALFSLPTRLASASDTARDVSCPYLVITLPSLLGADSSKMLLFCSPTNNSAHHLIFDISILIIIILIWISCPLTSLVS